MPKTALIAGTSGLVGSFLIRALLDSQEYAKVVSLGRRNPSWSNPKMQPLVVDFGKLDTLPADLRVDDVFCTLGTTIKKAGSQQACRQVDYQAVLNVARAGLEHGAKTFVLVSALGADSKSFFFYSRVKAEVEQALRGLRYHTLVILRPSLILGDRKETRPLEEIARIFLMLLRPLLIGPLKKYRGVEANAIAWAMYAAAQDPKPGITVIESDHISNS